MRFLLYYVMICSISRLRWGLSALLLNKIPTIAGQEDTPQVGSFLPIDLGTIFNEHTPTTKICVINTIIGINDLILVLSA